MGLTNLNLEENDIEQMASLEGFWQDSVELDKMIVERHKCPKCKNSLVYNGFANATRYKAFGICFSCEYAKHFWTEPSIFGQVKNKLVKRGQEKKAA